MDHFELSKLSTSREKLQKIVRAFIEMQSGRGLMSSEDNIFRLFASNDLRSYSNSVTTNYLSVVIDYLGEDDRGYIKFAEFAKLLAVPTKAAFAVPGYAIPMGWSDELIDKVLKPQDGMEFNPASLKEALSYLLRINFSTTERNEYFGVIFRNDEMITTNGDVMFIQRGMPVVTQAPRLLGFDAAMSLLSILRSQFASEVHMGVAKKSGTFGVRVELDDGAEMYYWSRPRYHPIDDYKDPRPPVDPRSVGFVVHSAFLESLLEGTVQAMAEGEKPVMTFVTTSTGLRYTSYRAGKDVPAQAIYQGELPMTRSMQSTEEVTLCVRADFLLPAIKGLGESVQFIVPYHPILGLEVQLIEPFYVNCNQHQFALLAPYVLDREMIIPLEKLRRKANNAMET